MRRQRRQQVDFDEFTVREDVLTEEGRALLVEDDELAPWEAGFLRGATDWSFDPFEDPDMKEAY